MRRIDASGDGKVSRDEFRDRTRFFDLADRDGDGKLSAPEFLVIRGIMVGR
ncbi:EF-hand domain-containing protein [Sinorhizobium meliloti]|uniref:EF-hand domain-containing protein n=1 Tax=Rhizobium meliloti TaxID=382 RepID=UPI001F21913C|nr:EF-hand domain-containing protein [Sinorhizobium meliloti]